MSTSGYTLCPCCGYDTISSDMSEPELCSDCIEADCDADGDGICCCESDCERSDVYDCDMQCTEPGCALYCCHGEG